MTSRAFQNIVCITLPQGGVNEVSVWLHEMAGIGEWDNFTEKSSAGTYPYFFKSEEDAMMFKLRFSEVAVMSGTAGVLLKGDKYGDAVSWCGTYLSKWTRDGAWDVIQFEKHLLVVFKNMNDAVQFRLASSLFV